jgi:hypothetical protein
VWLLRKTTHHVHDDFCKILRVMEQLCGSGKKSVVSMWARVYIFI